MLVLTGPAALCALAYLALTRRPPGLWRSVLKTASVALLALAAALAGVPMLAVALGFCALGDWYLSRPGDTSFMAGVAAFAMGHLVYGVLFVTHPASEPARLLDAPRLVFLAALVLFGLAMLRLLLPRAGALAGPVALYVPIIVGMGVAAATLPPLGALAWALPAALAFMASDAILAAEKFVLRPDHPAAPAAAVAIWVLYWCAQAGFLAAFA